MFVSHRDVLSRCVIALGRPGVNGFLGTADLIEDLALLGALDGKLVYGSMNRGGLAGAAFEMGRSAISLRCRSTALWEAGSARGASPLRACSR